jgi:hypothetical protein
MDLNSTVTGLTVEEIGGSHTACSAQPVPAARFISPALAKS